MRPMLEAAARTRRRRPRFDGESATVSEFQNLPDDGFRYELHDGVIRVSPIPSTSHDLIVSFLVGEIFAYTKRHPVGFVFTSECDVQLGPRRVFKPDVKFVARENRDRIRKKRIRGAPDLVVEVVSPDDPARDRRLQYDAYQRAGVREYWIIDSESLAATFFVHDEDRFVQREPRGRRYTSIVLKGFRLDLDFLAGYVERAMSEDE